MTEAQAAQLALVLLDVRAERLRQHERFGEQSLPDGTGSARQADNRDVAQYWCELSTRSGSLAWRDVLDEEVAEALAESDPGRLRAELVQVAAVAVQWIEALDRRASVDRTRAQR